MYYVEEDYLDRANVRVMTGKLQKIDKDEKYIKLVNHPKPIHFDKRLVAWGTNKKRFDKNYQNVHYLSDRYAHAKVHNEILKAKRVLIYGSTLDAF